MSTNKRADTLSGPDYAALELRIVHQRAEWLEKRCALQLETIRELRAEVEDQKELRALDAEDRPAGWHVALNERDQARAERDALRRDLDLVMKERDELERVYRSLAAGERYVLMTATPEAFGEAAVQGADAHKRYEEELEALFATHRREVAKLQLESDRRARSVAEAVIERVTQIGITERRAIEDINIEAIVDGSRQS